jgi:hypothetical protein
MFIARRASWVRSMPVFWKEVNLAGASIYVKKKFKKMGVLKR